MYLRSVDEVKEFTLENYFSFLYVSSEECNVCKDLFPKVEELLKKYPKIESRRMEINDVQGLAGHLSIFTIPAVILYIDGMEYLREARFISIEDLDRKIERYYTMAADV